MKKFILSIFIATILASVGYSQVALSTKDSLTSLLDTDIMPWQRNVTGTFLNRQMSWNNLKLTVKDYLDDQSITWAGIQTFNGATFASGSHGKVLFDGDSVVCTTQMFTHGIQRTQTSSIVGRGDAPFFKVYAQEFAVINPEGNDSVTISYDDSTLSFDKKVTIGELAITDNFAIPDSASFDAITLSEDGYTFSAIADTIINLTSPSSSITFRGFGFSVTGVDSIRAASWAGNGTVIVITNEVSFTVVIEDSYPSDGNIDLSSAFSMGVGDVLALKYNSSKGVWREMYRNDKTP